MWKWIVDVKALKIAIQVAWTAAAVRGASAIGAIYGCQQFGPFGSIALGIVGFVVGAIAAASPALFFQLLR
jgi:hypothetical protein